MWPYRGILENGILKEWESTKNIFHIYWAFCCLWAFSWTAVFGFFCSSAARTDLAMLFSSTHCKSHILHWVWCRSLFVLLLLWSSSCLCPRGLLQSQVRDRRALQGCTWLLPCSPSDPGELVDPRHCGGWKKLAKIIEDVPTAYSWLNRTISRKKLHYPCCVLMQSLDCLLLTKWIFFICSPFIRDSTKSRAAGSCSASSSAALKQH